MQHIANYFSLWTQFQLANDGYVLLAYIEMCGVDSLKEVPESFPVNGKAA